MKDGYVPQEEVPLYESKAKKIQAQRPSPGNSLPVGMCPLLAQAVKEKQEKQLKKQQQKQEQQQKTAANKVNATPGLLHVTSKFEAVKKPKNSPALAEITSKVDDMSISEADRQDLSKKLKKLRKKLREIEEIEQKMDTGELAKPEKDQLDKVARKSDVLAEIQELESTRKLVK